MIGRLTALTCLGLILSNCGISDSVSDAQQSMTALQSEFESFDLTCSFDEISGNSDAESSANAAADSQSLSDEMTATDSATSTSSTTSSSCESSEEQYSVLVDEFDADGDGVLSDSELAEAQAGWEEAQKAELDSNGDGVISEDEKATFRQNRWQGRKDKLDKKFQEGCKANGKDADECRQRRGHRREQLEQQISERMAEFDMDKDGKLNPEERKALMDKLHQEREQRKDEFGKKIDKNGDGKIDPDERQDRREERKKDKPGTQTGGGPNGSQTGNGGQHQQGGPGGQHSGPRGG